MLAVGALQTLERLLSCQFQSHENQVSRELIFNLRLFFSTSFFDNAIQLRHDFFDILESHQTRLQLKRSPSGSPASRKTV